MNIENKIKYLKAKNKKLVLKDCDEIYFITHSLQAVAIHLNMCCAQGLIGPIVAGRIFNQFKAEYLKEGETK